MTTHCRLAGSVALRFGWRCGSMVHVHGGREKNNCVCLLIAETRMPTAAGVAGYRMDPPPPLQETTTIPWGSGCK